MTHWWNRSKKEQKRIRKWAREPLATNLRLRAEARAKQEAEAQLKRRASRIQCAFCQDRMVVHRIMAIIKHSRGSQWATVPCPRCRPKEVASA